MRVYDYLIAFLTSFGFASLQANQFPVSGDSLANHEYLKWERQESMYRIQATRFMKGQWLYFDSDDADSAFVFGKPVRAMRKGKVIACWRGASDNPTIGQFDDGLGLDTAESDTITPKYGNHLWIAHDDGSQALYAHLKEGSVSASICRNDASQLAQPLSSPEDHEFNNYIKLKPNQQVQVEAGQLIGRVGNSGMSSVPQLGIRLVKAGQSIPLIFDKGLVSIQTVNDQFLQWKPINGQPIPMAEAIVWPTRSLEPDLTFFKQPLNEFSRLLPWLRESGFWPVRSDTYRVDNTVYINVAWRPSTMPWQFYALLDDRSHEEIMAQAFTEGYSLKEIDTVLVDGELKYTTFYVQDLSPVKAQHAMSLSEFNVFDFKARKAGFGAAAISVQYLEETPVITALYRPDSQPEQVTKPRLSLDKYQVLSEQMAKKKMYPSYVNAYQSFLGNMVSVIFERRKPVEMHEFDMDLGDVKDNQEDAAEEGLLLGRVSGFDNSDRDHLFVGFWEAK